LQIRTKSNHKKKQISSSRLITTTAASCGQGVGVGMGMGILCKFVCIIFKTGKSCGFGYVLVASFSKLENNAKKMGVGVDVGVGVVVSVWVFGPLSFFQVR
jgi:hypothetical protein